MTDEAQNGTIPRWTDEEVLTYLRSGMGTVRNEIGARCGKVKFVASCEKHPEQTVTFPYQCGRLQCPVCLDATTGRLAKDARDRINGLSKCLHNQGVKTGKLKHVSFSIPIDRYTKEDIEADGGKAIWKEFYALFKKEWKFHDDGSECVKKGCKEHHRIRIFAQDGFYGGVALLHLERKQHRDGTPCDRDHCKRPASDHVWVWGPHIHYLGYGFFENSVFVEKKTGWAYHIIEDKTERDPYTTVKYQLTHCALFVDGEGNQVNEVLRWIGVLSRTKGGKKVLGKTKEFVPCPICKANMHRYGPSETDEHGVNWNYDQGELYQTVEVVEWYLTKPKSKEEKLLREQETLEEYAERWRRHPSKRGEL